MTVKIQWAMLFLIMLASTARGQDWAVWSGKTDASSTRSHTVVTERPFNGITFRFDDTFPEDLWLTLQDGKMYQVTRDAHVVDRIQSNLIFLNQPESSFRLIKDNGVVAVEFFCQFVSTVNADLIVVTDSAYCDEPTTIPQSVWRDGLPDPIPGRFATPTRHCIVHHSASPVSDTNSMALVRSFYIQHTQVNGWDDIGYNYLIGHDGTVFAGRDPERPGIRQDDVFGAHFCGKNRYTMGICVIGSFEEEAPQQAAMDALMHLLAWKIHKDGMQPLDSLPHPDTLGGPLLPIIAGHRNGCATECPGQQLFDLLEPLRTTVADLITTCAPLAARPVAPNQHITLFPIPASQNIYIQADFSMTNSVYEVFAFNGSKVASGNLRSGNTIALGDLLPGMYLVRFFTTQGIITEKITVIR